MKRIADELPFYRYGSQVWKQLVDSGGEEGLLRARTKEPADFDGEVLDVAEVVGVLLGGEVEGWVGGGGGEVREAGVDV